MAKELPDRARVVIVGGGIAGCSIAYHLTKLGWKDVVLLERKTLTGGTTWHAAGLVTQLRNSRTLIEIAKYGVELYPTLEAETGLATGFRQTGSVTVARTEDRMDELRRILSLGRSYGIEIETITPREAGERWPLMSTDGVVGGLFIPKDGQTIPTSTGMALARGAETGGASIFENTRVTGVSQRDGAVSGVSTDRGDISCEVVVNCAGMWSREIGLMCGVKVPLHAAEHMYLITNRIEGVTYDMPSLRDPDGHIYFRRDAEEAGGLLMGGFEPVAKPWGADGVPEGYHFGVLDPDWEHFRLFWERALERVPGMEAAGINRKLVSAESFTPDNRYLMGEAPELKNFFLATGLNSTGIAASAGVGKAMAEWIVEGEPTMDLWEVDVRRFHQYQNNRRYLYDRTVESVGLLYGMHWPHRQPETARNARRSPLHDRLASKGAAFGVVAGWERPNWYAPEGVPPKYEYSYGRQNWFPFSAEEHKAVREAVGLFDQTSFAKFMLQGRDAERVLQRLCANDVAVPSGRIVYTAMLNHRGGIETDLTVTRLAEDRYMIVTSGSTAVRDFGWIERHIGEAHAFLTDVTSAYAVLAVMGPRSRELLSSLTDADMSGEAFPFMASREIDIGYSVVQASRITYVGELGWELYIPTEFAAHVYDVVVAQGEEFGLRHAGFHSMDSLRSEKAYRAWGLDIIDMDTPLEAGLGFAVAFDKETEFIGMDALLRQRENGLVKRLVVFTVDDPEPLLLGDEPIYRDGELVGRTTSGSYGHTLGRSVGMGYVEGQDGVDAAYIRSGSYEIEIAAERFPATAHMRPPYDPRSERVRA